MRTGGPAGQLHLTGVTVRHGELVAVDGFSATARSGEVTAVTGPSGAGKTSLLWAVGGLLGADAVEGQAALDSRVLGEEETARGRVVLIPQSSALAEVLSARENVLVPLIAAGADGPEASARAEETLAAVGLDEHGDHLAEELSGGQRQRVAIARGLALAALHLASGSVVLLADEPTSELDHDTRQRVVALIRDIAHRGAVVLMATNDPEVADVADVQWRLDE